MRSTSRRSTRSAAPWRRHPTDSSAWTMPGLTLKTSDELRGELERGLTRDSSDLNPCACWGAARERSRLTSPPGAVGRTRPPHNAAAVREALVLPLVFLTVTLAGGLRIAATGGARVRAAAADGARAGGDAAGRAVSHPAVLVRTRCSVPNAVALANVCGVVVLTTLFLAAAQVFNTLTPEAGLLAFAFNLASSCCWATRWPRPRIAPPPREPAGRLRLRVRAQVRGAGGALRPGVGAHQARRDGAARRRVARSPRISAARTGHRLRRVLHGRCSSSSGSRACHGPRVSALGAGDASDDGRALEAPPLVSARSGRSVIKPSTPQPISRRMSASSLTVQTCTSSPARCAWRMKRGETTRVEFDALRHLERPVGRGAERPARRTIVERLPDLDARRAGAHPVGRAPGSADRRIGEPPQSRRDRARCSSFDDPHGFDREAAGSRP